MKGKDSRLSRKIDLFLDSMKFSATVFAIKSPPRKRAYSRSHFPRDTNTPLACIITAILNASPPKLLNLLRKLWRLPLTFFTRSPLHQSYVHHLYPRSRTSNIVPRLGSEGQEMSCVGSDIYPSNFQPRNDIGCSNSLISIYSYNSFTYRWWMHRCTRACIVCILEFASNSTLSRADSFTWRYTFRPAPPSLCRLSYPRGPAIGCKTVWRNFPDAFGTDGSRWEKLFWKICRKLVLPLNRAPANASGGTVKPFWGGKSRSETRKRITCKHVFPIVESYWKHIFARILRHKLFGVSSGL